MPEKPLTNIQETAQVSSESLQGINTASPVEQAADTDIKFRRQEAGKLLQEGASLRESVNTFDNNYSELEELYREKVGVDLISDPAESAEHSINITKSCSVVIPAYNNSARLRNCLSALQYSTFNAKYPQQLEVIVVDDGSPQENIADVIKDMDLQDLNIKVFRQSNGRAAKARYSGVLQSTGDIVLLTDPDIVYTPTAVEEYMKRHEVLDNVAFFGLRNEIDVSDERLQQERMQEGSLGDLSLTFENDSRVRNDAMEDSDWLKNGGKNRVLPMDTDNEIYYGWTLKSVAWSLSVSAPRDVLLETLCGYDERYVGWGYEDEHMAANLVAEGYYLIPNTGGVAYHQTHTSNVNEEKRLINQRVWEENFDSPLRVQNVTEPLITDASLQFEVRNNRSEPKEVVGMPDPDLYKQAHRLMKMGKYAEAVAIYNEAEIDYIGDYWFMHDKAVALTALGGKQQLREAITYLEDCIAINPDVTWVQSSLAIAYGRNGDYSNARQAYENALRLDPENWQAKIINHEDEDIFQAAEKLHVVAHDLFLMRGKPREALRYYDAALALVGEETQPWSLFDKGKALMELKQYEDAKELLMQTQRIMPHETWPDSQLGLLYEALGRNTEAKTYYESALLKYSDNQEAKEGLQRVT